MTVIIVTPMSEGIVVAADGEGAAGFDGPYVRLQKAFQQAEGQVFFIMGNVFKAVQGNILYNLPQILLTHLPVLAQGNPMHQLQQTFEACANSMINSDVAPVYNNNIATVGIVRATNDICVLSFDKEDNGIQCSLQETPIERTMVFGPSTVQEILRNPNDPDHARVADLVGQSEKEFFVVPGLPIAERDRDLTIAAMKKYIAATKIICHLERRISPIGRTIDVILSSGNAATLIADNQPCTET